MKYKFFPVLVMLLIISNFAFADGIIIPRPIPDIPQIPPLSVKYHHVNISIDNQYAKTEIDQVFENGFYRDLEGTYIFPLPEDASISEFSMFADNEKLDGKILEKDKAKGIYEGIVRRMRDPALLEYTGRNAFTARVYPIPARGEKRIQLSYSEVVKCDNGICKYTYPLETEKFSSKPLNDVVISVKLKSKQAIKTIYSPTHKISIKRTGDYDAEVSYEENNIKPDKDFVLYWTVSEDDFGANLVTYKEDGKDGFFILMLSPKQEIEKEKILPKDIVFVLDTSGSMSGKKVEQAKNALKFIVNNLNENDRFDIITFNTGIEKFEDRLMEVNSEGWRNPVQEFIDKIDASGGTNIHDALIDSLKLFNEDNSNSAKIIVFLTDGLPTVGVTETNRILEDVKSANRNNTKIFTFGVGYDVNTHLLDKISVQNNGASEYVEPDEDIEVKVSGFYGKISSPVLSDVKLEFNGDVYSNGLIVKEKPAIDSRCSQKAKVNEICSKVGYEFDSNLGKCIIVNGTGCIDELPFKSLEECQKTCESGIVTGRELKFETIDNANWPGIGEKRNYVIKNKADWQDIWAKAGHSAIAPEIDFTKNMIMAAFYGVTATGGYNIEIKKIIESADKLEVFIKETSPGKGCIVTQATTEPRHIIKLQKSDKEIVFKTEKIINECEEPSFRTYDIYPKEIPDMFKGSQLIVFGRYSGKGNITLKLTGKSMNKEKAYSYNLEFPEKNMKNDFIQKLWASRKIGYLLDEIRLNGENKEIVDEIINLSLKYGIMTPYTSFLVDMDKDISRPAVREEARDMFNSIASKSFSQTSGAGSVKIAQSMQDMQKSGISQDGSEKTRSIEAKTFYNRDGTWTGNDYAENLKITNLDYGSEEYFKLLNENPELGKYLSLGKNVKFCFEDKCFSISENKEAEVPPTLPTLEPTTIPQTTTTPFPESPEIENNKILVQAIAIVGLLILISFGILLWNRRR